MRTRTLWLVIIVSLMVITLVAQTTVYAQVAPLGPARQSSLVVNTTDDSNGTCDLAHCSFREALKAANANLGSDTISFNIPLGDPGCNAAGVCTISPNPSLPDINDGETTIDGFTQPGAIPNSNPAGQALNAVYKIVLDGTKIPSPMDGLRIFTSGNLVRGLVIHHFYYAISIFDANENYIEGNYIGTDVSGTSPAGNVCDGVTISSLQGGNGSWYNVIGGSNPEARNLISANGCAGVSLGPGGTNLVQGNIIGADASGTLAMANNMDGIYIFNASNDNLIGGKTVHEANLIAYNANHGVLVMGGYGAAGNTITHNYIHSNAELGIALLSGANNGIEHPIITAATRSSVSGTACSSCTVEIFSDVDGQGAIYEGIIMAGEDGVWNFSKPSGMAGPNLTATNTDNERNTSEFSSPVNILSSIYLPLAFH